MIVFLVICYTIIMRFYKAGSDASTPGLFLAHHDLKASYFTFQGLASALIRKAWYLIHISCEDGVRSFIQLVFIKDLYWRPQG